MGLRFRKSISIIPGVKLNFGKTGMSVSTGVPGFRKTFHTSGRVTTSVGIPGTGLYYVDTKNTRTQNNRRTQTRQETPSYHSEPTYNAGQQNYTNDHTVVEATGYSAPVPSNYELSTPIDFGTVQQIDTTSLKSIHKASDDSIDWTEVLVSPVAPDETYNQQMWSYYHSVASKILAGDIDTYLQVINDINPLNDLLDYGTGFEFGTDSPLKMEVEFQINSDNIDMAKNSTEYQDYVCSVAVRIARDIFALLPVQKVVVHAANDSVDILSVCFDKKTFSDLKFSFIAPSETINKFEHNMSFGVDGFGIIDRIE